MNLSFPKQGHLTAAHPKMRKKHVLEEVWSDKNKSLSPYRLNWNQRELLFSFWWFFPCLNECLTVIFCLSRRSPTTRLHASRCVFVWKSQAARGRFPLLWDMQKMISAWKSLSADRCSKYSRRVNDSVRSFSQSSKLYFNVAQDFLYLNGHRLEMLEIWWVFPFNSTKMWK